ncbi:FliH/SctL family protein [Rubinisphaera sp. JC750]|uniref:FliH/SctL family protein n=1 Tax=Rubinisphaera sp. JC750 TaxID=2898658 RepID=UPI001F20457B|nr:FliH/SctL family protein [Rubinisphaera sp. JC750]
MKSQSRVLKSGSAAELVSADQFNYEDLQARCENYLDNVREQSRKMLLDSQAKIEQERKAAVEAGRQEGLAKGLQQAEQQIQEQVQKQAEQLVKQRMQKVLPALAAATEQLENERQQCIARWEQQGLELVLAISEKLVHERLGQNPGQITVRVAEILNLTLGSSRLRIRLCESDLKNAAEHLEVLTSSLQHKANVELVGDPDLQAGDCIVETEHGQVDGRISMQLARIAAELAG